MPTDHQLPAGVPPLTTFYAYLTGGCNLACRHCWIAPTFEQTGGTGQCLPYDLFEQAVTEGQQLGLEAIKFTGGEPLLHPEFVQMADHATEKGLRTWIETNGTLITRELALHLKDNTSLFQVSVSLDGAVAATHDAVRNVAGSFDAAVQGLQFLVEVGYRPQVIMSLFPENLDEIEPFVKLAVGLGCGSVKFNVIQPTGRGEQMWDHNSIVPLRRLLEIGTTITQDLQKSCPIPLLFTWPMAFQSIEKLKKRQYGMCNLFNVLGILPTCELAMCGIGRQEKELVYGILGDGPLADVWSNSPGLQNLRSAIPAQLEGVCGQCLFRNRCLGACVALNFHSSRRLTAPHWFCEQAYREGLFPATRLKTDITHGKGESISIQQLKERENVET